MKRRDVLKEFLSAIFGVTTVKPIDGKIYKSGSLFTDCEYNDRYFITYLKLIRIAFLDDKPQIQAPNFAPKEFNRLNSISDFLTYLQSYDAALSLPPIDAPFVNKFAFNTSRTILSAIFSDCSCENKYTIENEEISAVFRKALDKIPGILAQFYARNFVESTKHDIPSIIDEEYHKSKEKCNYSLNIQTYDYVGYLSNLYSTINLEIYIDKSEKFDEQSSFFFNDITSKFLPINENNKCIGHIDKNRNEFIICKPLSFKRVAINIYCSFDYHTYIDEEIVLSKYKCNDRDSLQRYITEKARNQYKDHIDKNLIPEIEKEYIIYFQDIIKRVMSLNLQWLYDTSAKEISKCKEEVEKIVVGYPEIYSYIDNCSENVSKKQLLAILHNSVKAITNFITEKGELVSECAMRLDFSEHIKYVSGIINGSKFKGLNTVAGNLLHIDNEKPKSIRDLYYFTSSNELNDLLSALKSYYECLKKSKKSS